MTSQHQAQATKQAREAPLQHRKTETIRRDQAAPTRSADMNVLQRAVANPALATPADILALQRAAGNRTVTGLIQAKLIVGPVGDRYEQEADRVAEQVVASQRIGASANQRAVQRQAEEEEEIQTKPLAASITPLVQRQAEEEEELQAKPAEIAQRQVEEEEELQAKPAVQNPPGSFEVGPEIESHLTAQRGSGSPLPDGIRALMEPSFGADFSGVRVHADGEAAQMNRALNARAFTHGQDIYLGADSYASGSDAGNQLLAHELTHVVQQAKGHLGIAR